MLLNQRWAFMIYGYMWDRYKKSILDIEITNPGQSLFWHDIPKHLRTSKKDQYKELVEIKKWKCLGSQLHNINSFADRYHIIQHIVRVNHHKQKTHSDFPLYNTVNVYW